MIIHSVGVPISHPLPGQFYVTNLKVDDFERKFQNVRFAFAGYIKEKFIEMKRERV